MSRIFHRSTNTIARVSIFGAVFIAGGFVGLFEAVSRSPWVIDPYIAREQPIQFSHERHVAGNGIDCRYCHTSVEDSSFAGIPPTKTCMNYHSQIFSDSPFLEPVRDSFRTGDGPVRQQMTRIQRLEGAASGYLYRGSVSATRPATDYTTRAIPNLPGVAVPLEAGQILWQR